MKKGADETRERRTIIDYLETERLPFADKPFNEVDSLILSRFCSAKLEHSLPWQRACSDGAPGEGLLFADLLRAEDFRGIFLGTSSGDLKEIVYALAASPRFRDTRICHYATAFNEKEPTQFAAAAFICSDDLAFVGFRGTDCTLTGWREDFGMGYLYPVPSQIEAAAYLEEVAERLPKALVVGGHSKGGNLAQFAALNVSEGVQSRIRCVYCRDSPGFRAGALTQRDVAVLERIACKTIPQESLVGMLLNDPSPCRVVHSCAKGLDQHTPTTWEVNEEGTGFAVCEEGLAPHARFAAEVIDEWLAGYEDCDVPIVVDALFNLMEAAKVQDLSGLLRGGSKSLAALKDAAMNVPHVSRDVVLGSVASLVEIAMRKMVSGS